MRLQPNQRAVLWLAPLSALLLAAAPPAPPGFSRILPAPSAPPGFTRDTVTPVDVRVPSLPEPRTEAPRAPPGFDAPRPFAPPPGFLPGPIWPRDVPAAHVSLAALTLPSPGITAAAPVQPKSAPPPGFAPSAPAVPSGQPVPVVTAPEPPPGFAQPPPAPAADLAWRNGSPATLALEHEGRVDGAVLISDLGLALCTARALAHPTAPISAALLDGRRVGARVLAVDPSRDLALVQLEGPGPFPTVALAGSIPDPGSPALVIVQPGALAWTPQQASVSQRWGMHQGRADPLRLMVRVASPVLGEGGPALDAEGRLLGIVAGPELGQNPAEAVVISVDAIRGFLDRAGVYAPSFALMVSTTPVGATVTVDGKPAGDTAAGPLRVDRLTLGRHEVRLAAPGMAEDVVSVELVRHAAEGLTRGMDPGGTLAVTANTRANVWIDGSLRGQAPAQLVLPSGRHVIDVRAAGYLPATKYADVQTGKRVDVDVPLERITGELSLDSVPPGADVSANGEPLGKTPLSHAKVSAGALEIGLHLEGKHGYKFALTIAPRESRDLGTYRLEEPYGWLDPKLPYDALISVDDGPRHAPVRYERLTVGEHKLTVFAPGYYAYSQKLLVGDAQTIELDPPLALYDQLPARRATGMGLTGAGIALGLVSIGLATDDSTKNLVTPGLLAGVLALGVGAWCLVTSPRIEQSGWSEERTWVGPAGAGAGGP